MTDKNSQESNSIDQMDSDDDIVGNDKFKERIGLEYTSKLFAKKSCYCSKAN